MLESKGNTTLSKVVFGHEGLPLSPFPGCIAKLMAEHEISDPATNPGQCNLLGCACEFCYGARQGG
jgi:hypothetical protein